MDPAAEVARIKAETAARDAAWLAAIRGRLEQGPATSRELSEACGCGAVSGSFSTFLAALRRSRRLVIVGMAPGPTGIPNLLWEWARDG
jgi:hypothetical protein